MKTGFGIIYLVVFLAVLASAQGIFAQNISSKELIDRASQYDGKLVVYSGEAVGEVMPRQEFAWINVHDGSNALGIWLSRALAQEINFTGSFQSRGDFLEVTGIFHRACPEHGGDLDIHAQGIRMLRKGEVFQYKINLDKRNLTLVLLGILSIWTLTLLKRK